ncbi:MAG: cob(I)yrinic acid a,c-diamide adenosyltransferase [Pseudomonadota bacterium]
MSIITKTGDKGTTKTLAGNTVSKTNLQIIAGGTLDELISCLGLAKTLGSKTQTQDITNIQNKLIKIGAEISSLNPEITDKDIAEIETKITELEKNIKLPKELIIPGNNPGSAGLDLARAIARRMEREVVELQEKGIIKNKQLLIYCNRLSDYLFLLARQA